MIAHEPCSDKHLNWRDLGCNIEPIMTTATAAPYPTDFRPLIGSEITHQSLVINRRSRKYRQVAKFSHSWRNEVYSTSCIFDDYYWIRLVFGWIVNLC